MCAYGGAVFIGILGKVMCFFEYMLQSLTALGYHLGSLPLDVRYVLIEI